MKVVIVGNGPAAIAAAETVRSLDAECALLMVSKEDVPFYSPCPLAEYVEESVPRENLFLRDADFYDRNRIETSFGVPATALDTARCQLTIGRGAEARVVDYDRLLLASGARSFLPPIPGLDATPGVTNLKTLADADGIVERLPGVTAAVVIGSGFIGLEAAQALVRRGVRTTVFEALGQVLPQMLSPDLAARVHARLVEHGIDVHVSAGVQEVLGGSSGVTGIRVGDEVLPCDLVVCATGVRPDIGWLAGSGIETGAGVHVNDRMETSAPGVFAAGDIVEGVDRDGSRRVIGTWPNAVVQGQVAGVNLCGGDRRYAGPLAVNVVRIFDVPVASFGQRTGDRMVSALTSNGEQRLLLQGDRIVGGQFYGSVDDMGMYMEMMNKGVDIREIEDRLLKPGFGLGALWVRTMKARRVA